MKLTYVYTIFVLGILAFLSMGSSAGRAGSQNWGNTGAPGDQMAGGQPRTCISCHGTSAAVQVTIGLEMMDAGGNVITGEYKPDETYGMKVALNTAMGSPLAYGFQMLGLNAAVDENGPEASNYSNPSANVQIATASFTDRTYVEQLSPSSTPEFTFDWTAPAAGSGPITFYLCGNGVNLNMSTSGDNAACTKIELAEDLTASTNQISGVSSMLLSPNPSNGDFVISIKNTEAVNGRLMIRDLSGKQHYSAPLSIAAGESIQQIDFDAPAAGLYFVQISTDKGLRTEKLIVQ